MQLKAEHFRKAREHLSDPKNWNRDGNYFQNRDPSTGCGCAYGAIGLALSPDDGERAGRFANAVNIESVLEPFLPDNTQTESATAFNDIYATHDGILAMFDRAIAHYAQGENS